MNAAEAHTQCSLSAAAARRCPTCVYAGTGLHDTGNAERLYLLHGERLRYVPKWNAWLVWTGSHWRRDDQNIDVTELAKDVGRSLIREADEIWDPDIRDKVLRWGNQSLNYPRIRDMIRLARGVVDAPSDDELLDALDALGGAS